MKIACRILAAILPATVAGRSTLGDLLEEYHRRPRGPRRFAWFWLVTLDVVIRYLPGRLSDLAGGMTADCRLAFRMITRQPWSALSIAGTLALGIGATTAIYAVFNFVLFRPVPGVSADAELVTVTFRPPGSPKSEAYGHPSGVPAMRGAAAGTGLMQLGYGSGSGELAVAIPRGQAPTLEGTNFVSSQFFDALGVRARLGRLFTDAEADRGSDNIAVISEELWRDRFDGSQSALGQTIAVNGHPFVIIGVADRFRGWGRIARVGDTDVWLPYGSMSMATGDSSSMSLVGRVRPGSSLKLIEQQLQAGYASAAKALPPRYGAFMPFLDAGLLPSNRTSTAALQLYWLLMSAVSLLLVLACANAANLLLARAAQRERDTAVRLAIGAGRWRIVRQLLVESVELGIVASGLGLLTAVLLTSTLRGMRVLSYFPALTGATGVEIDGRVLAFCVLVTMATVLVFGLLPAVLASRTDILGVLGRSNRSVASPHRLRRSLVVVQIALSLVLVAGAGVLNQSLRHLFAADLGVNLDHVIDLELRPDDLGYDRVRSARVIADTMNGLQRAGFDHVAVSYPNPLTGNPSTISVKTPEMATAQRKVANVNTVSPDYFQVLGQPLMSGRTFTTEEAGEHESVNPMPVVVNATMARDLFGGEAVVGRTFDLERSIGMARLPSTAVIIGVAGDSHSGAVRDVPKAAIYHTRGSSRRYGSILVRSNEPAGAAMQRMRQVVHDVDPALPITTLRPLQDDVTEDLSEDRVIARLSAMVALLAALLSATGVGSVISQIVIERKRDFGIRTALGASSSDILGHVLKGVTAQSAVGVLLGLALYSGVSRWLEARLFGVAPLDPVTLGAAVIALVAVALGAAMVPARRATRIDPAVALRAE